MRTTEKKKKDKSLGHELRTILALLLIPLVLAIAAMIFFWAYYAVLCSQITHNVSVCSEFSLDFKEKMDLKMYHYVVGSREQLTIPVEDISDAVAIAKSLEKTTEDKESRRTIRHVINYCNNLIGKMFEIRDTTDYDSRLEQLENNIYVLTDLIQEEMGEYIYHEAGRLAAFERKMLQTSSLVLCMTGVLLLFVVLNVYFRSRLFVRRISQPIQVLCENVGQVGKGNFEVQPAQTEIDELRHLNEGIQKMARRICVLLEDVKKEEKEQNRIQFQLLQEQINPHFLYNTLDTIVWLVECGKDNEATLMLTNLSSFFRTSLSKGENIITLEEEIRHTRSYLDIQQVRYRDIMNYEIVVPKSLYRVLLPKITIQPLVENALYHGIKCKRGNGTIRVVCEDCKEEVAITISDNGIGMTEERRTEILEALQKKEPSGFGLRAVDGRIRLYFGEEYGLQIDSVYGEGTTVKLRFPKRVTEEVAE